MITLTLNNSTYAKQILECLSGIHEPIKLRSSDSKDGQSAVRLINALIQSSPKVK